jgi:hypothetical protein
VLHWYVIVPLYRIFIKSPCNFKVYCLITYTHDKAICEWHGSTVHDIFNGNVVNVFGEAMFHVTG